jgi:hypothetical protein
MREMMPDGEEFVLAAELGAMETVCEVDGNGEGAFASGGYGSLR